MACGSEVDRTLLGQGPLDAREHLAVVREKRWIKVMGLGKSVLQGGFTLSKCREHFEQRLRAPPKLRERSLDQKVRSDERSIEIDHERAFVAITAGRQLGGLNRRGEKRDCSYNAAYSRLGAMWLWPSLQ